MKIKIISAVLATIICGHAIAEDEKPFTMDGELGFIITSGNTETTSVNAALNSQQQLDNWSNEYILKGLYKKDEVDGVERTSAQKLFASAQGNYKLSNPDHRLFAFASYEDDRFSSFKYQGTLAGGWNQSVWKNDTSEFDYSIGPGYAFAETIDGEDADGFVVRGAFNYRYTISDNARFTQTFATEVGSQNTKSRSESAVTAKLAGGLSMKVALKFDHNTDVAEGIENLDTETSVNLVYSFF